ncbi:hypothetical protein [Lacticaseibacillus paracasei]|uniref:hypothetical protein n=1 Tax=Lacticaseibacillus paracasei TaxID=1597 RepID=UPI000A72F326|nr:hypothetical protein [Lacticaseibacillus paracasei]URW91531.1 hypothetical protein NCY29_00550 [Lacticaseibacillus paracasei]
MSWLWDWLKHKRSIDSKARGGEPKQIAPSRAPDPRTLAPAAQPHSASAAPAPKAATKKETPQAVRPKVPAQPQRFPTTLAATVEARQQVESSIDELEDELTQTRQVLRDYLLKENQFLTDNIQAAQIKRANFVTEIRNQQKQISKLKQQISEMNLTSSFTDLNLVRKQIDEARAAIEKIDLQLKDNQTAHSRLDAELADYTKRMGLLGNDNREAFATLNQKQDLDNEKFLAEIEQLRLQTAVTQRNKHRLQTEVEVLTARRETAKREHEELTLHRTTIDSTLQNLKETEKQLVQKLSPETAQIKALQSQQSDLEATIKQTEVEIQKLNQQIADDREQTLQIQQKFANASSDTKLNITKARSGHFVYLADIVQIDDSGVRYQIEGFAKYFADRKQTPTILTTMYNDEAYRIFQGHKQNLRLDPNIQLLNLYDDLQARKPGLAARKVTPYVDADWHQAPVSDASTIRYVDSTGQIQQEVTKRAENDQVWTVDRYRDGQLVIRDVYDRAEYLSVTQTFAQDEAHTITLEQFYSTHGNVVLTKRYKPNGDLREIQLLNSAGQLRNVFATEEELSLQWLQGVLTGAKQASLMLDVRSQVFTALSGRFQRVPFNLTPVVSEIPDPALMKVLNRPNLIRELIVTKKAIARDLQELFDNRFRVIVVEAVTADAGDFHVVLPQARG